MRFIPYMDQYFFISIHPPHKRGIFLAKNKLVLFSVRSFGNANNGNINLFLRKNFFHAIHLRLSAVNQKDIRQRPLLTFDS